MHTAQRSARATKCTLISRQVPESIGLSARADVRQPKLNYRARADWTSVRLNCSQRCANYSDVETLALLGKTLLVRARLAPLKFRLCEGAPACTYIDQ